MKKIFIYVILPFICFSFFSCASKPSFTGKGDLCGLVIDENNTPVKEAVIYCQAADEKKLLVHPKPVLTNESGLFVFYGLPSGDYILSGEKNNFLKIEPVFYSFNDRTKIICIQTKSFKAAVLNAEELLCLGQAEEAGKLLRGIVCEPDSAEALYIQSYLFYTEKNEAAKEKLISVLRNQHSTKNPFFAEYAEKLEEVNNE